MTTEAKQYAQRNRQGSDWFSHEKPVAVSQEKPAPAEEESSESQQTVEVIEEKQEIEEKSNKNEGSSATSTSAQLIKPKSDSNQWFKHDQAEPVEAKSPRTQKEGEAYCKRDKTGNAASWFKHEHDDEQNADQQRPLTAGGRNAARMRSESEHWFNHEGASGVDQTKRYSARPASSEMHGVFHHSTAGK